MTGGTFHNGMISLEREPALLVHGTGIGYDPRFGRVTPRTILSQGIPVHIGMTGDAFTFCFLKFKRFVTAAAISNRMLTAKLKMGCIMIECRLRLQYLPAFGRMTYGTIHFKPFAMRRLGKTGKGKCDQQN